MLIAFSVFNFIDNKKNSVFIVKIVVSCGRAAAIK